MSKDEFDARCYRAMKKAVTIQAGDKSLSADARKIAETVMTIFAIVEVAISEGKEP